MFRTSSAGDSVSVALRNCSRGRGKVRLNTSLQQRKQAVWTLKIRYQVKEFSILCMGRCKPLGSLNSLLSNAPQLSGTNPVSLLSLRTVRRSDLHSPSSSAIIVGVSGILWIAFWGAHSHVWRTEIADGCDISCLLIWQEIFSLQGQEATIRTGHGAMD